MAKNQGDGSIMRELPAIDPNMLKRVKFRQGTKELKDQILLETEGNLDGHYLALSNTNLFF